MGVTQYPAGAQLYLELLKKTLTASIYDESGWTIVRAKRPDLQQLKNPFKFLRNAIRYSTSGLYKKRSRLVVKTRKFVAENREEGKDWPLIGYTMTGHKRLNNVQHCMEDVLQNNIPGDFIETGAWRGGTTIFMRGLLKAYGVTNRKVWVADSFEGLPPPKNKDDGWDLSQVDYLKVSLEQVQANFAKFDLLDAQVEFIKGWFCDSLPNAAVKNIAVLRLDGDMYSSTMDALQNLYDKVSKGGYVIVDDYHSWPSCKQAVTDFLAARALQPEIRTIDWSGVYWRVA